MENRFIPKTNTERISSIKDTILKARERGSFEMDNLTIQERTEVLAWFKKHAGDIPSEESAQIFEQSALHGLISEKEAVACLDKMDAAANLSVAFFLFKTQGSRTFRATFQHAFCRALAAKEPSLAPLTKKLFSLCRDYEPRLTAPFIAWDEKKPLPDFEPTPGETASAVLPELIAAYEFFERQGDRGLEGWKDAVRGNIVFLLRHHPQYLYPELPRLIKDKLIDPSDEEVAKQLFEKPDSLPTSRDFEKTKAEDEAFDALIKRHNNNYLYNETHQLQPAADARLAMDLSDIPLKRSTARVFGTFAQYRDYLRTSPEEFIYSYLEKGYPVFLHIDQLGLSFKEIRQLILDPEISLSTCFDHSDLLSLLAYNQKHRGERDPDLEKAVIERLEQDAYEGSFTTLEYIAPEFSAVLSAFSPASREKIIDLINKHQPTIWLKNMGYAAQQGHQTLESLFSLASHRDDQFMWNLGKIYQQLRHFENQGRSPVSSEQFKGHARALFERYPKYLAEPEYQKIVGLFFSESERDQLIETKLFDPVDVDLLRELVSEPLLHERHLDRCREILRRGGPIWDSFIRNVPNWDHLLEIFTPFELLDLLEKNKSHFDTEDLLNDDFFPLPLIAAFTRKSGLSRRFLRLVEDDQNVAAMAELTKQLRIHTRTQDERRKAREKSEQQLREVLSLARAPHAETEASDIPVRIMANPEEGLYAKKINVDRAKKMAAHLQTELVRICEDHPETIFQTSVADALDDDDVRRLANQNIALCAERNPHLLLTIDKHVENMLDDEHTAAAASKHPKYLIFASAHHGIRALSTDKLESIGLLEQAKDIDPAHGLEEKSLSVKKYYGHVIKALSKSRWYQRYEKKLSELAQSEIKNYGARSMDNTPVSKRFMEIADRIALLEASPLSETLLPLAHDDHDPATERMLALAEFISRYDLDTDMKLVGGTVEETAASLQRAAIDYLTRSFGLEHIAKPDLSGITSSVIKALGVYRFKTIEQYPKMKPVFKKTLEAILQNRYTTWRVWGTLEEPASRSDQEIRLAALQKESVLPAALTLEQYAAWYATDEQTLEATFEYDIADVQRSIRRVQEQAVLDGHIESTDAYPDPTSRELAYSTLTTKLDALVQERENIKKEFNAIKKEAKQAKKEPVFPEELKERFEKAKESIDRFNDDYGAELNLVTAQRYLERLSSLSFREFEREAIIIGKQEIPWHRAFAKIADAFQESAPTFLSDIARLRQTVTDGRNRLIGEGRVATQQLAISDRVDLETHLLIGEKPVDSCQHYDGKPQYNGGLWSYVADPNVKILQISDRSNGALIGRAVMRLLEDDRGNPTIFLERVYATNDHPTLVTALLRAAKIKAERLGVRTYTSEVPAGKNTGTATAKLHNTGSRTELVYSDAGDGLVRKGRFSVDAFEIS